MFFVCGEQFAVFENYHLNHHYTEKYKNLTDTAWEWMWRFASKTAKATGTFYQALDIKGCSRHGELCHKVFVFFAIKLNKTVSKQFSHGEFIKKYFLDIAVPNMTWKKTHLKTLQEIRSISSKTNWTILAFSSWQRTSVVMLMTKCSYSSLCVG